MVVSWRPGLRRGAFALIAASLVVPLVGCGGDSSPTATPTPTPVPTPPPPVLVLENNGPISTCGEYCTMIMLEQFAITSTGTIDATVNYTHEETRLGVWIASGVCTFDQFVADQCQLVAMNFTGKPCRVSATGQPAGTYTLIIGNGGPFDEAVAYQVVFTAQAAASANPGVRQRPLDGVSDWGTNRLEPAGTGL